MSDYDFQETNNQPGESSEKPEVFINFLDDLKNTIGKDEVNRQSKRYATSNSSSETLAVYNNNQIHSNQTASSKSQSMTNDGNNKMMNYSFPQENHNLRRLDQQQQENLTLYQTQKFTYEQYMERSQEIEKKRNLILRNELDFEKSRMLWKQKELEKKERDLLILYSSNKQKGQTPGDQFAQYTNFVLPEFLFDITDLSNPVIEDCTKPYFCDDDKLLKDVLEDIEDVLENVRKSQAQSCIPEGLFVAKVLILFRTICQWYKHDEGSVLFSADDLDEDGVFKNFSDTESKILKNRRGKTPDHVTVFNEATQDNCIKNTNSLVKNFYLLFYHFLDSYVLFFANKKENDQLSDNDSLKKIDCNIDSHLFEKNPYKKPVKKDKMTHGDYLAEFKVLSRNLVYIVLLHYMEVNFSFQKPELRVQTKKDFCFLKRDIQEQTQLKEQTQLEVMYACPFDDEFKSRDYKQLLKAMICLFRIDEKIKKECDSKDICQPQDAFYILAKALRLDGTINVRKKRKLKNDDHLLMIENDEIRPEKRQK